MKLDSVGKPDRLDKHSSEYVNEAGLVHGYLLLLRCIEDTMFYSAAIRDRRATPWNEKGLSNTTEEAKQNSVEYFKKTDKSLAYFVKEMSLEELRENVSMNSSKAKRIDETYKPLFKLQGSDKYSCYDRDRLLLIKKAELRGREPKQTRQALYRLDVMLKKSLKLDCYQFANLAYFIDLEASNYTEQEKWEMQVWKKEIERLKTI